MPKTLITIEDDAETPGRVKVDIEFDPPHVKDTEPSPAQGMTYRILEGLNKAFGESEDVEPESDK